MKKGMMRILASISIMGCAGFANGQSTDVPAWSTSKDVQKISNKQLFEDENLKASHINAVVLNPTWNQSKGVQRVGQNSDVGKSNVTAAPGAQHWTISKGVQQIQHNSKVKDTTKRGIKREE
ncbi:MAG: hypothetical protein ABIS36_16450 [Chryseolinea sp.]